MFNRIAAITIITFGVTLSVFGQGTRLNGEAAKALSYFQNIRDRDFESYLSRIRLPEVSADHTAEVLENLSRMKEASISGRSRVKIDAILPILQFHNRQNSVEIKVVEFDYAFVKLQGRAVMLISHKALNTLSAEQLQALVAHELAHEYFWRDYFDAKVRNEYSIMRMIELLCDGVAIITLEGLNLDSRSLNSGLAKLNIINIDKMDHINNHTHPLANVRIKFHRAMTEFVRSKNLTISNKTKN
ncbi:MAG: hypothetical protein IPM66_18775 [Acidobacteriota bacterium]|nr:MAG: hypothetical protein IPM66_18775 [Acidobacteriota bacterium]